MDLNGNYLVVKHNDLIEACYKLTLHEQKLVLAVAMQIKPDDKDFHEYQIAVADFVDVMGIDGHGYHTRIRGCAKTLLKKPVVIHKKNGGELICNWFSSIEYSKDATGNVELCFDPKLKPYLLQLKREFTEFRAGSVMKLKSAYSIRIYELLKQYKKIGKRRIEIEALKQMLGVNGRYKLYGHFKSRVLTIAQAEINSDMDCDIRFEYEEIKIGRKVIAIEFTITHNQVLETSPEEQTLLKGIPPTTRNIARKSIRENGIEATRETIARVREQVDNGAVSDQVGYIAKSLSSGTKRRAQGSKPSDDERRRELSEQAKALAETEAAEQKRMLAIDAAIEDLPPEERARLYTEAEEAAIAKYEGKPLIGLGGHARIARRRLYQERYIVPEK